MKKSEGWSHGILLVMLGIVFTVLGFMQAMTFPFRGIANWAVMSAGIVGMIGGTLLARSAKIDRSLPANEKRIPSARVHRSARR